MKKFINRLLSKLFGFRIGKIHDKPKNTNNYYNFQNLLYEKDTTFHSLYDQGIDVTGTPFDSSEFYFTRRRNRFYNTLQFFNHINDLEGKIIECGCFKGLSSYLMCNYLLRSNDQYKGEGFIIIDSFEGLSTPSSEDSLGFDEKGNDKFFVGGGFFATPMEQVKNSLSSFPEIQYYKGWIPPVLSELPPQKYRFVHIDVDLYLPIKSSLEYFYPNLITNGIIVIDDYGSLYWPGAKKAVEEFCEENRVKFISITSGQAVILKK